MNSDFTFRPATVADAPAIARAVIMAVGHDIVDRFAGGAHMRPLMYELFTRLAARPDAQYSYRNSIVAEAPDGSIAGVAVVYDGARLHTLRPAFTDEAHKVLGIDMNPDEIPDETTPDEVYLDSLAVFEPWRRLGLGRRLIACAADKARSQGKPLGLICEPDNTRARTLYESLGFRPQGQRPFADTMMDHYRLDT